MWCCQTSIFQNCLPLFNAPLIDLTALGLFLTYCCILLLISSWTWSQLWLSGHLSFLLLAPSTLLRSVCSHSGLNSIQVARTAGWPWASCLSGPPFPHMHHKRTGLQELQGCSAQVLAQVGQKQFTLKRGSCRHQDEALFGLVEMLCCECTPSDMSHVKR